MPTEYTRCPLCGEWAKVIRHKDREHRDRARGRYSNDDKRYRSEPERPKTRKRKKG